MFRRRLKVPGCGSMVPCMNQECFKHLAPPGLFNTKLHCMLLRLRRPLCPHPQALTSGGGKAEAFSAALASAVATGGCGSVSNVLAQAQSSAESSGKGAAFAQSLAQAQAVSKCVQKLPNCSTKGLAAQNCCTAG